MIKRYKSPFDIYIVWHPDFIQGKAIADFIYKSFSRDTDLPFSRGLGIPVYYRSTQGKNLKIPTEIKLDADYNAIIVLIDDTFYNDDQWNNFVKKLIPRTNTKTRLYPIAFSNNAFYFEETTFGREQFINSVLKKTLTEFEFSKMLYTIRSRLIHAFCRLLLDKKPLHKIKEKNSVPAPIKLFISHAKMDNEREAENFRDYVRANTKLSTFFDANDIADGYEFDTQIKKAIEDGHAALIVFHSDAYSSREWCRIEILTAKRFKSPVIVVINISKGEKRSFPYMGNVPTIKYFKNNFDEIIDTTLYQVLGNLFHKTNLKRIKDLYITKKYESIELTSPPELFNYLDIMSRKSKEPSKNYIILYPDPPIGLEEVKVLQEIDSEIKFLTPIQLSTLIK